VQGIDFSFDKAYWMSGLEPVDPVAGTAQVDAVSLAIGESPVVKVPEAGGPTSLGQTGPWVMEGQQWVTDPLTAAPAKQNAFTASLSGARAVQFDLARMRIDTAKAVTGSVTTTAPLELGLSGSWTAVPTVTVGGAPVAATLADGVLHFTVPTGTSAVVVG
jgi:hypothetical protein